MFSYRLVKISIILGLVVGTISRPQSSPETNASDQLTDPQARTLGNIDKASDGPKPVEQRIDGADAKSPVKTEASEPKLGGSSKPIDQPQPVPGPQTLQDGPLKTNGLGHKAPGPESQPKTEAGSQPDGKNGPEKSAGAVEPKQSAQLDELPKPTNAVDPHRPSELEMKNIQLKSADAESKQPAQLDAKNSASKNAYLVDSPEAGKPLAQAGPGPRGANQSAQKAEANKPVDSGASSGWEKKGNASQADNGSTQRSSSSSPLGVSNSALTTSLLGVFAGLASIFS